MIIKDNNFFKQSSDEIVMSNLQRELKLLIVNLSAFMKISETIVQRLDRAEILEVNFFVQFAVDLWNKENDKNC